MVKRVFVFLGIVCSGLVISGMLSAAPTRSAWRFTDFVDRLTNLEALTLPPRVGVTCKQFSSYDRHSRIDPKTGKLLDWAANGDAGNFLRKEPEGQVLADMDGPGCIVRLWSANPHGTLKVFIDGAKQPTLECPFVDLIQGKVKPFEPPLVGFQASGANCFVPIPYQKHCKVVVKNPGRLYYHVQYVTFPKGTSVESFSLPLSKVQTEALKKAAQIMNACGQPPREFPEGISKAQRLVRLRPGAAASFAIKARDKGEAIRALLVKKFQAKDTERALREVLIRAKWDGHKTFDIWCPLGDFFGSSPGINEYKSLPLGMTKERFYCYWVMPFQKTAAIEFVNEGKQQVEFQVEILYAPMQDAANRLYFRAKWRRDYPNTTFDWPFLDCKGRGRYCGVMLTVWNPRSNWWGEGDEKIWVDGEKFPSIFGTGSEDYFGYAWCSRHLFTHAFHDQTLCEGPGNGNYTSVNRWQIADNVPFQKSILVTIENYARDKEYVCTTYWYATADTVDTFKPVPLADRMPLKRWKPTSFPGVIEAEDLKIVAKQTKGAVGPQNLEGFPGGKWSLGKHVWFRPSGPKEWVDFAVPVKKAGRYELIVYLTKARDYGVCRFLVNGQAIGSRIDLYNPTVTSTGPIPLGTVELKKGDNILRLEVIGKSEKSIGYMAGIDCIKLKPVK